MNSKRLSILLGIVVVILLAIVAYMALKDDSPTNTLSQQSITPNNNLADDNSNNGQSLNNGQAPTEATQSTYRLDQKGYHGTLTLTGYLNLETIQDFEGEKVQYAFFRIIKTNSDLIYDYLKQSKGNSFVRDNAVGLGCYQEEGARIYSTNDSDNGTLENIITGNELQKLLSSSQSTLISLQLSQPILTGGRGAPVCYSHFREFEIK